MKQLFCTAAYLVLFSSFLYAQWGDQKLLELTQLTEQDPVAILDSLTWYRANVKNYSGDQELALELMNNIVALCHFLNNDLEASKNILHKISKSATLMGTLRWDFFFKRSFFKPPNIDDALFAYSIFKFDRAVENNNEYQLLGSYIILEAIYEMQEKIPEAFSLNYQLVDLEDVANGSYSVLGSRIYDNLGRLSRMMGAFDKALEYHNKGLEITPDTSNYLKSRLINHKANIGNVFRESHQFEEAVKVDEEVLGIRLQLKDTSGIIYQRISLAIGLANTGKLEEAKKEIDLADKLLHPRFSSYQKNKSRLAYAKGTYHLKAKEYKNSAKHCSHGYHIAIDSMREQRLLRAIQNCQCTFSAYDALGDKINSYKWYKTLDVLEDSLFTRRNNQSQLIVEMNRAKEEENRAIEMAHQEEVRRKNRTKNILLGSVGLILLLSGGLWSRLSFMRKSKATLQIEKDRSENLLLNILPAEIAAELKEKGEATARKFDNISILFTDFKKFTEISQKLSPTELVAEINYCFKGFDKICKKYNIEKIKTIGDAYMAAGGLPVPYKESARNTVLCAIEMQKLIKKRYEERTKEGEIAFEMRLGINTGPVVAGIVGVMKFQYDVWGDTVNTASRLESNCFVGHINISQSTYNLIKDDPTFSFDHRGKIYTKGKGEVEMYFVKLAEDVKAVESD